MYEKNNVLVFDWAKYNIPWDETLRTKLVQLLVGKPIVIYVAGIRQAIGVVRQTRLGREGVFADLVLETEEIAVPIFDEQGKVKNFGEIKIEHYGPKLPSADESKLKIVEEKLKIAEEFIYQPTDFEEYNQELKLKGLPLSEPSVAAQTEEARKFEKPKTEPKIEKKKRNPRRRD